MRGSKLTGAVQDACSYGEDHFLEWRANTRTAEEYPESGRSLPSLAVVSRDLARVLKERYSTKASQPGVT